MARIRVALGAVRAGAAADAFRLRPSAPEAGERREAAGRVACRKEVAACEGDRQHAAGRVIPRVSDGATRRRHGGDDPSLVRSHPEGGFASLARCAPHEREVRKQWLTGAIPVVPFPAVGVAEWHLDWSYADDVAGRRFPTDAGSSTRGCRTGSPLRSSKTSTGRGAGSAEEREGPRRAARLVGARADRLLPRGRPVAGRLLVADRRRLRRAEKAHRAAMAERYSSSSRPS